MNMSQLLSWVGWWYLPSKITGFLLTLYYGITIRAGDPRPQPGTARYAAHWRNTFILVIGVYFLYTIYEADWQLQREGSFYADLGVGVEASEKAIASRFRKIATQLHPDKISDASRREAATAYFAHLNIARGVLEDPTKRFAYDRFGRDILEWSKQTTKRDYVMTAVSGAFVQYIASIVGMFGATTLGIIRGGGKYWRYLILASLAAIEFTTITNPAFPSILSRIINPLVSFLQLRPAYLPFQYLSILRKASLSSFIAVSQISSVLDATQSRAADATGAEKEALQLRQAEQLENSLGHAMLQAKMLFDVELAPFRAHNGARKEMESRFREWIVQDSVRMSPAVRERFDEVMNARRRAKKGTRT